MKAIILHHPTASVYFTELPEDVDNTERVEEYLTDLGFNLEDIHYMTSNENIPIYPCNRDESDPGFKPIVEL